MSIVKNGTKVVMVSALAGALGGCGISDLINDLKDEVPTAEDFVPGQAEYPGGGQAPQPQQGVTDARATIDTSGGVVATAGGAVDIPAGALAEGVEVSVSEVVPTQIQARLPRVLRPVGPALAFTPHGQTFQMPVTLTLFHGGVDPFNLVVVRLDDENDTSWERVEEAAFGFGAAYVTSTHFSIYGVLECDAFEDPSGYCGDLVSGALDLGDVPEEDLGDFAAPGGFGGMDASGEPGDDNGGPIGGRDPGDGEPAAGCKLVEVCDEFVYCAYAEPTWEGEDLPPPGDEECIGEATETMCWEMCEGGVPPPDGGSIPPPPEELDDTCRVELVEDAECPFVVTCAEGSADPDPGEEMPPPETTFCPDPTEPPPGCVTEQALNECGFTFRCDEK